MHKKPDTLYKVGEFVTNYLRHKAILQQARGLEGNKGWIDFTPPQISMDFNTFFPINIFSETEKSLAKARESAGISARSKVNIIDLSAALVEQKNRSNSEKDEVEGLMIGTNRYVDPEIGKRLGISEVPERIADHSLPMDEIVEILTDYRLKQSKPVDLLAYLEEDERAKFDQLTK